MESELWFHLLNKKNLKLFGSIGYLKILQAENSDELFNDNDSLIMSKYLANNSGDKFNYNITFQYKKLMLNFSGIYKARVKS